MTKKHLTRFQNGFCSVLVLIFTLSALLKSEYSISIPLDFGGYSSDTENSLVINEKVSFIASIFCHINKSLDSGNEGSKSLNRSVIHRFLKLKLNKYFFPNHVPSQYLNPDHICLIQILPKSNIIHQSSDDTDPLIS